MSLTLLLPLLYGCPGECESIAPQFQLDIQSGTGLGSIEVVVYYEGQPRARIIDVGNKLDDGETSLVIELPPELDTDFDVNVEVSGYTGPLGGGFRVASATDHFEGSPDGCNRFELALEPIQTGEDGGIPPRDTGVVDTGVADAGEVDLCDPICINTDCQLACTGVCAPCQMSCTNASNSCNTTCDGQTCDIWCRSVADCFSDCSAGGTCNIRCEAAQSCTARCQGANCRLDCTNVAAGGTCSFTQCAGGQTACPDGSIVCNRACP